MEVLLSFEEVVLTMYPENCSWCVDVDHRKGSVEGGERRCKEGNVCGMIGIYTNFVGNYVGVPGRTNGYLKF